MTKRLGAGFSLLLLLLLLSLGSQAAEDTPPAVKRSSSPIAVTADGATLLVVNPDSNSVTLVDTVSLLVLAEVRVGVDPRSVTVSPTSGRAYVANQGTDSLSVIDVRLAARLYPLGDSSPIRPYVGGGLGYYWFLDVWDDEYYDTVEDPLFPGTYITYFSEDDDVVSGAHACLLKLDAALTSTR